MTVSETISAVDLERLVTTIFRKAGWPEADCAELSRHLVGANLTGHDSHGVGMIPAYAAAIRRGDLRPSNTPRDLVADGSFLVIDAHLALGQKVAADAVTRACAIAAKQGVCILNLVNAHHIGRVGHYAEMAADSGLVSMFWVNVAHHNPAVAPFGGREGRLGTNPHTVGIPNGSDEPLILDFATSRIAMGKVRVARNKGERVAPDILLDRDGRPSTDPSVMYDHPIGALLTFGEHKGSGVSIVAEILSAVLGMGTSVNQVPQGEAIINNLFGVILDPSRLGSTPESIESRLADYIAYVRSSAPRDPEKPVLIPGEPERNIRAKRMAEGIPIDSETWRQVLDAAKSLGVDLNVVLNDRAST